MPEIAWGGVHTLVAGGLKRLVELVVGEGAATEPSQRHQIRLLALVQGIYESAQSRRA